VLADSLSRNVDLLEGVAQVERERLPVAARAVQQGRDLGEYMLAGSEREEGTETEQWREFRSTRSILKHTASSAFLYCNPC
jgi:hypothetical protein